VTTVKIMKAGLLSLPPCRVAGSCCTGSNSDNDSNLADELLTGFEEGVS